MNRKVVYACSLCGKQFPRKNECENHEKVCIKTKDVYFVEMRVPFSTHYPFSLPMFSITEHKIAEEASIPEPLFTIVDHEYMHVSMYFTRAGYTYEQLYSCALNQARLEMIKRKEELEKGIKNCEENLEKFRKTGVVPENLTVKGMIHAIEDTIVEKR